MRRILQYLYNEKLIFLLWNDHGVRIFQCNFKQAGLFNGIFEHRIENILIFLSNFFFKAIINHIVMIKIRD